MAVATPEYWATGRRKTSVARVRLRQGSGSFQVNGRALEEYFPRPTLITAIKQPFVATNTLDTFDCFINVRGGGMSGQAGAVRHGITRALLQTNETLRPVLRKRGFLTRDPRMKERKKYGQKGARARFQFSKR